MKKLNVLKWKIFVFLLIIIVDNKIEIIRKDHNMHLYTNLSLLWRISKHLNDNFIIVHRSIKCSLTKLYIFKKVKQHIASSSNDNSFQIVRR